MAQSAPTHPVNRFYVTTEGSMVRIGFMEQSFDGVEQWPVSGVVMSAETAAQLRDVLDRVVVRRYATDVATVKAIVANPPFLLFAEAISLACGLAMIVGHNIWSGGALPVVVTLVGWLMVIRGASLLALSPAATTRLVEAMRYEQLFYFYMAGTLVLGLYLTWAGFRA